jgi:excinuclease ABC subunit C
VQGITYAAIAKGPDRNAGREWFHMPGREPFQLIVHDPVLHYLQRLRDEAHRFAINAHRNKRSKSMQTSELDAIAGIGAVRKKALLLHFGSAKGVAAASLEEIAKVEGVSRVTAQLIYNHFHGGEI